MEILVLGASGMAGHTIALYLKKVGHEVTAFTRTQFSFTNNIIGDVTDFVQLKKIITEGDFDAVINCIGILNADAESYKPNAVLLNSYLPHFLCEITEQLKTKIIHMSTDCIFSGATGKYTESSFADGRSFYDRSKALGEIVNNKDLTFRNSIIGPDMNSKGIGLFNWFMAQDGEINGYSNAIWNGVTTLTLAKAINKALTNNICGLYNLVNNSVINKFELLSLFNQNFKNDCVKINIDPTYSINKSLVNSRDDFDFVVPSYSDMILEMKDWIEEHSELYPHYK